MTYSNLTDAYLPVYGKSYNPRAYPVQKVTVHHMAGDLTIEGCQSVFAVPSREASSNYGIGSDGRIGCYVDEENGGWTSASWWNDNLAITIEVADEDTVNWVPSEAAYESTVKLCADICTRYGIEPYYDGTQNGTFTEHLMYAPTGCPGPWWHAHMPAFVEDVRKEMQGEKEEPVTYEEMEQIAEMCAAKVAESAYWDIDKKAVWGPTGQGGGKYQRNTYNVARFIHDQVCAIDKKIDKVLVGGIDYAKLAKAVNDSLDYEKLAKAVNDDAAKRMQS